MHFLGDLGVDLWLLVAQIVNFLFLLWLLSKFVYKPLLKKIESDEAAILEIEQAKLELEKKEKQLETKEKQFTTRTKNRAKAILSEAEEIASTIKSSAQFEAQSEKQAVIDQINQRLKEVSHDGNY